MGDVDAGTKFEVEQSTQSGVYFLSIRGEGDPGLKEAVNFSSQGFQEPFRPPRCVSKLLIASTDGRGLPKSLPWSFRRCSQGMPQSTLSQHFIHSYSA